MLKKIIIDSHHYRAVVFNNLKFNIVRYHFSFLINLSSSLFFVATKSYTNCLSFFSVTPYPAFADIIHRENQRTLQLYQLICHLSLNLPIFSLIPSIYLSTYAFKKHLLSIYPKCQILGISWQTRLRIPLLLNLTLMTVIEQVITSFPRVTKETTTFPGT